jgi:glutamate-1-semialdehyde 2,1-aminomutase
LGRYQKSEELLKRAEKVIPGGTQTFSKSKTQYPFGISPFYAAKGEGSRLWDADGNEYIDFVMGLCSTILGYNDPDVQEAVENITPVFSLPTELEIKVAEKIIDMVPCAEMVRFGKNGSDATTGAIRLARAYTGRDYIIKCKTSYHGYHSWSIWHVNNLGIPEAEKSLTLLADYNNIESFDKLFREHTGEVACVIMEPTNVEQPKPLFLNEIKELCRRNGAVFILDEVITGFRFSSGGAQKYFGVIPDLCCLGKGLGNGYSISAVAGKANIMNLFEKVHFSFTFGGERIGLAAANAVLDKLKRLPINRSINLIGTMLINNINGLITACGMKNYLKITGNPTWSHIIFKEINGYNSYEIKSLFMQEVFKRGILTIGTHNICYSHNIKEIDKLLQVYCEVFPILKDAIENKKLYDYLECEPIKPLYKVR